MFYRLVRSIVSMALGLFYKVEVVRRVEDFAGPVMFVGNHPNSLIDPAMVFMITERQVTFLAREPLFRVPVLGWILRGVGALPVYRKQDHPGLMAKNGSIPKKWRAWIAASAFPRSNPGHSRSTAFTGHASHAMDLE